MKTNPIKLRRRTKHIAEVYRDNQYLGTYLILDCGHWLKTERIVKHPRCPKCERAILREMEIASARGSLIHPPGFGVRRCSAALDGQGKPPRNTRNTRNKKGYPAVTEDNT